MKLIKRYQIGGYVQPSNVQEAINNGSAAGGLLEGFGRVMSKILPEWMQKASTYVSPLNYAAALSKGSINPKVGEEVISKWHPNLQLAARTGEIILGGKAVKGAGKTAVNTAAKAGNKTARSYLISKELNSTIKKGLKPATSKTDRSPYSMDDLVSNYNSGKQNLESWWLDRELNTGDPNKLVHFDNGDFKPHFYKNGIHGDKVKGAYVKNGKLIPSGEGEFQRLWWSQGKPFQDSHFNYEQSSDWGQPKRYITVDSNASDFEQMYYSDPVTMRYMPTDEIVSNGPIDLSNASIIQKSPFGWWERVKYYQPKLQQDLPASLKFFERKPARISEAERAGVSKGERNQPNPSYTLNDAINEARQFSKQWGYEISDNPTIQEIENLYNRHNTFFRGVTTEGLEMNKARVAKDLNLSPDKLTKQQFLEYVSTHPWPGNDRIWVTPRATYGQMYGGSVRGLFNEGQNSAVMRPWKQNNNIREWPSQASWELGFREQTSNPVITPWASNAPDAIRSLGEQTEMLAKGPLIYRGIAKDFKGTNQTKLKYSDNQGKLGWIESQVGELPQEIIIEKQGGKLWNLKRKQQIYKGTGIQLNNM